MPDIISSYYQGILQQVRSEVDLINSLFKHQGIKGEGNEAALRELLRRFIPKKYGVGTGVIIDKEGNCSQQCDIIVYDTFHYPSLLSLTAVHLFPVDIVYAIIQVKTTLTKVRSEEALDNIASVRKLHVIQEQWTTSNVRPEGVGYKELTSFSPMGFIFAYNSKTPNCKTFKSWFIPILGSDVSHWPTFVVCLDQGFLGFKSKEKNLWEPQPGTGMRFKGEIIRLKDGQGQDVKFSGKRNFYNENGVDYPVKKLDDQKYVPIDQSRVLLVFLLFLHELLSFHPINPAISFVKHYFRGESIEAGDEI